MRIQRNREPRSAAAAPFVLPPSQQRRAMPHPGQRRASDVHWPCLTALAGSLVRGWLGRGLPSPSRKGAGTWLLK